MFPVGGGLCSPYHTKIYPNPQKNNNVCRRTNWPEKYDPIDKLRCRQSLILPWHLISLESVCLNNCPVKRIVARCESRCLQMLRKIACDKLLPCIDKAVEQKMSNIGYTPARLLMFWLHTSEKSWTTLPNGFNVFLINGRLRSVISWKFNRIC